MQHAVEVALDDVAGWASALSQALDSTGGELSAHERTWADSVLDPGHRSRCGVSPGVTLDAGALIGLERNDRRVLVLLARAQEVAARVTVPATALAQAVRAPARQARLARLVRQPTTDVRPLDRVDATAVGRLLAASGTADVVDAHVVLCARRAGQSVATSDPDDLRRLYPSLTLIVV